MALGVTYKNSIVFISYNLLLINKTRVDFVIIIDFYSLIFRRAVLLISSIVILYSFDYMGIEKFFLRFHIILITFVLSIILLIYSLNIVALIVGWDGLGLRSYLLVIYYQRFKASNAGILTALRNRVGDVFIIISCGLSLLLESSNFYIANLSEKTIWINLIIIIFLARITKSAQIPFSAWLPAAIAAPTPVSALVHSSTLVTAGVYLIIRFNGAYSRSFTMSLCLWVGTLTIIIAGLAALNEFDTKKIVALSTLSQLGLIISCLASSSFMIAYFHLITHAFIKAILFLSMGNLIHRRRDYQDIRKSRITTKGFTLSGSFIIVANLGLAGTPFLAGFYSKDMWIEIFLMSEINYLFIYLFYFRVFLTVAYRARLIFYVFSKHNLVITHTYIIDYSLICFTSIFSLWAGGLLCGNFLSWFMFETPKFPLISLVLKNITLDVVVLRALAITFAFFKSTQSKASFFLRNLWGLPAFRAALTAVPFLFLSEKFWKFIDLTGQIETLYLGISKAPKNLEWPNLRFRLSWIIKIRIIFILIILIL